MGRLCFCRRSFIALGVSEGKAQFAHNTSSLRAILLLVLQTCNHIGSFNVILPKHPNSVQCRLLPSHGSGLLTEFRLNSRNYEGTKFGEEIGPLLFVTLCPDIFSRVWNWNVEISSFHFCWVQIKLGFMRLLSNTIWFNVIVTCFGQGVLYSLMSRTFRRIMRSVQIPVEYTFHLI